MLNMVWSSGRKTNQHKWLTGEWHAAKANLCMHALASEYTLKSLENEAQKTFLCRMNGTN